MPKAVVLFSGGLDSILSARILHGQGFKVEALNIRTLFNDCQAAAVRAARLIGARLSVLSAGDEYLEVVRNPSYGYGKGVNPCVDCRIYMCRLAKRFMEQLGACVVVTGEVLGQRPMSQKRHDLEVIARRSGLDGRLLRPLSAKRLPPTAVETEGLVDRRRLYDLVGRGRRRLIDLAAELGMPAELGAAGLPSPSSGCALAEPLFASKVRDLMRYDPQAGGWDFALLKHGRHFRFDRRTKVVVGRNARDNATLRRFATPEGMPESVLLGPEGFRGPEALVVGRLSEAALRFAAGLIVRYARKNDRQKAWIRGAREGARRLIPAREEPSAESARPL